MAEKKVVSGQVITLDYAELRDTRYERCKLVYKGGESPTLINNDFVDCEWLFENEARSTMHFLRNLVGDGAGELVMASLGLKDYG